MWGEVEAAHDRKIAVAPWLNNQFNPDPSDPYSEYHNPDRPRLNQFPSDYDYADHRPLPHPSDPDDEWTELNTRWPRTTEPHTLYRGMRIDLDHPQWADHPDVHGMKQILFGEQVPGGMFDAQGVGGTRYPHPQSPEGQKFSEHLMNFMEDVGQNVGRYREDYSDANADSRVDFTKVHDKADPTWLGRHWTTNPDVAEDFAFPGHDVKPAGRGLSVMMSADWDGRGEDVSRSNSGGSWKDEDEINLLPGAGVKVHGLGLRHHDDWDDMFHNQQWHNVLHTPQMRSANLQRSAGDYPYTRNNNGVRVHSPQGYGQDVEPWGRYMNPGHGPGDLSQGWERGYVSFDNPLHLDEDNWKQNLSQQYGGATGQALSDALLAEGYDGIMTSHPKYGPGEMVDIRPRDQRGHTVHAMAGYDEYAGHHRSPGPGTGWPVHEMTNVDESVHGLGGVPEDWYTHPQYYSSGSGSGDDIADMKRTQKLYNDMRGKPDHPVTIYRALPHGNTDFNTGDWVTPSESYARQHAIQDDDPANDWPIIKTTVPAKHLYQNGDSYDEFGYHGPMIPGQVHGQRTAALLDAPGEVDDRFWGSGGCGAMALAFKNMHPDLKIGVEWDRPPGGSGDHLNHAWVYDENTGKSHDWRGTHHGISAAAPGHTHGQVEMDIDPVRVAQSMGHDWSPGEPWADENVSEAGELIQRHWV